MTVPTNVRSGVTGALLAGFQSVKGSYVTDFTAADTWRLWTETVDIPEDRPKSLSAGQDGTLGNRTEGSYRNPNAPVGSFVAVATPDSIEALLRSNLGPMGAGGEFTLVSQIQDNQWLTLAWVEDVRGGTQRLVRVRDCWVHRLVARIPGRGRMTFEADWAGRAIAIQALNAGGVTLPADPMPPGSQAVLPTDATNCEIRRDPMGANQQLRFREASLMLDQGLIHKYSQGSGGWEVYKRGLTRAYLRLTSEVGDETWDMIDNGVAGTKQRYRLIFRLEGSSVIVWQVDLYAVQLKIKEIGNRGRIARAFVAEGEAHLNSDWEFIS